MISETYSIYGFKTSSARFSNILTYYVYLFITFVELICLNPILERANFRVRRKEKSDGAAPRFRYGNF